MATSITSLRNPIDDLTSQLNQPPTKPVGSIEEQLAGQRERGARAEELRPQVMKESLGSVETAMQDLQAKRVKGAEDYGTMLEKQAKDTAALEEKYTAMRPEPIEFAPTQQTPEQLQTIAISMMLVGALAGGGAKRSGIAGLKAMTGMLDGYKQGRKDVFDREKIIFEKALETQKQKIEEIKSLYDSALRAQIAGQTAEAKKYEAQLQAELAGGTMLVEVAQGRNNAVMKMLDAASTARDKATESMIAINKANEDRKARLEQARATKEMALSNQLMLENLRQENRKEMEGVRAGTKMGTAGPRFQVMELTGKKLPTDKLALDVINTGQGLLEVSKLRDRLQDPEIQTGLRAVPAPILTKIRSLVGRETTEGDIAAVLASKELSGTDKTTLFIKDAILAAFKIEQGLTGTRVPVFTQKTVGPILDPRAYSPETYDKLLETRQKELFGRGKDYGFDEGEMSAIARVQGMPGTKGTKPAAPQQPSQPQAIPAAAIDYLKRNPNAKADFDAKYGAGSADRYLSGAR